MPEQETMPGDMAKDYKDHGGSGRVYESRFVPRIVFAILLITIAFLGYSYWVLLTSHRDTSTKITQMKVDLDSTQAARAELTKLMESCKDELKLARQEEKRMKDSEASLQDQVKTLEGKIRIVESEKSVLDEKLKNELENCQQTSRQEVALCKTTCETRVIEERRIAEEACQKKQAQQDVGKTRESIASQDKQEQLEGSNVIVQQIPTTTQAVNA